MQELLGEGFGQGEESLCEERITERLLIPDDLICDATEIIFGLSNCLNDGTEVAFAYCDSVLYARIFDGDKYLFPLPFMLTDDADAEGACINLAAYCVREMIPMIITDVPRDEIEFLCSVFPHVDAFTYDEDDDCFFAKINNECDMVSNFPTIELDGIVLGEISVEDKEKYAQLCRDRELNKYWGYDVDSDNPDGNSDFYMDVVRREFDNGIAITFAVREGGEFVGEASIYGFDYRGAASIAVRVLKDYHSRGIGSRATNALIAVAKNIGLSRLTAEIMNENEGSIRMTSKFMDIEKRTDKRTFFTLTL